MREKIGFFLMAFLAVCTGLVLYYFTFGSAEREQRAASEQKAQADSARVRTELDETRAALNRLADETTQVRKAIENVPTPALDTASLLVQQDFVAVHAMRVAMAESYMSMGVMPADNAAAGLPAPDAYRGKSLVSATLSGDGVIELVFDEASGVKDGRIRMIADVSRADSMGMQWRCESPDYVLIKRILPLCEYTGPANSRAVNDEQVSQ